MADDVRLYVSGEVFLIDSASRNEATIHGPCTTFPCVANDPAMDFRPGKGFGLAIGREWNSWRVEASYSRARLKIAQRTEVPLFGTFQSRAVGFDLETYLISGFADLAQFEKFEVYVGAGAGVARWKPRIADITPLPGFIARSQKWNTKTDLVLAGTLGLDLEVTERLILSPNFKLVWIDANVDTSTFDNAQIGNFLGHSFALGMRYRF
jgi:opacity protein-like surface antigen